MDKVIDIQNWTRKEEYLFFRTFLNPMISVTVEVDCTTAYRKAKERQQPFSLYYMHAAVTAANRIEEFRYRQVGEEVILYERIDLFTPVQNADGLCIELLHQHLQPPGRTRGYRVHEYRLYQAACGQRAEIQQERLQGN